MYACTLYVQTCGPKMGGCCAPFFGGGAGSHLAQCGLGRETYLRTKWHLDPSSRLDTINMGRKVERLLYPFREKWSWVPI